jgi:hypothetical protein
MKCIQFRLDGLCVVDFLDDTEIRQAAITNPHT